MEAGGNGHAAAGGNVGLTSPSRDELLGLLRQRAHECLSFEDQDADGHPFGPASKLNLDAWYKGRQLLDGLASVEKIWTDLPAEKAVGDAARSLVEELYAGVRRKLDDGAPLPKATRSDSPRGK